MLRRIVCWRTPRRVCSVVLGCRRYGYVHVPKKTPPHLLGHGSQWRKCFVVHPQTQAVDPLTKYQWLTQTTVIQGLPDGVATVPLPESLLPEVEKRIREALVFQIRRDSFHQLRSGMAVSLLQVVMATLWPLAPYYHHLNEFSITVDPKVECFWRMNGNNFLCLSNPSYILHTSVPLQLFCDPEFRGGSSVPSLQFQPFSLGLFEHSFDQILPFGGCKLYSPFSFAHTTLVSDYKSKTREQLLAYGLMQLFSQAAGRTVQYGYPLNEDLIHPLATQAIVTNGREFTFICYQLNTLDLNVMSNSRQNVLWAGPTYTLYEDIELGKGLQGFSNECVQLFLRFLLHKPTGKTPSASGFTLAQRQRRAARAVVEA